MTRITIIAENPDTPGATFRASTRGRESVGPTAGAALDGLADQLGADESGTLVVVQNFRPDQFFTAQQQRRLGELLAKQRTSREAGKALSADEYSELEALIDAELDGATKRSSAMVREMKS
jgi:uncharacterized protein (DUF1501 family)